MTLDDFLARLHKVRRSGKELRACCPAHDDQNPSLSIGWKDGNILLYCFAGCATEDVLRAMGLTKRDLFDDGGSNFEQVRAKYPAAGPSGSRGSGKPGKPCDWGKVVATYIYEDADGKPLHYVERTSTKQFPQGRFENGRKVKGLGDVKTVLYRLPQLLAAPLDRVVYLTEGEKDVHACEAQGLLSSCNPGGALKFRVDHAEPLRGRPVVIVMDRDEPGEKHALQVARQLAGLASSVRIVRAKTGKDAHDHFAAGHSVEEFEEVDMSELIEQSGPGKPDGSDKLDGPEKPLYREHGGRIERFVRNREGDGWAAVTENFTARIVEQVEIDDGVEHSREYAVEGVCDGRPLRRVRVPAKSFDGLGWIGEQWGAFPIVKVGQSNTSHAATAMKMLGRQVMVERTIYQHLGWRDIGGSSVYLHAGGALGAEGGVAGIETALPNQLAAYALSEVEGLSRADALRASMTFLQVATADVAGTLYAALWRAVIGDVNFSVFVTGPTGTQKSSLTAALVSHFGSGLTDKEDLSVQWASTANAIEGLLFSAKDAILPVDDYVPSRGTAVDRAQMQKTASRVLRAAGNRAGRSRMYADGTLRTAKPPRGMLLATGEELPDGGSELRRTVVVTIERGGVDLATLSRVQEHGHRGANATAMVAFVRWVAGRRASLKDRLRTATKSSRDGSRLAEQLAELRETVGIWCEFAAECGLAHEEIEEARAVMTAGVASVGQQQEMHSKDQDPVTRYLEVLSDGLASGALAVVERQRPAPEILGAGRSFIGWEDDDYLYLIPSPSFAAISKLAEASHRPLQLSISALHRALHERGVVVPQGSRTVSVLQMGGKGTRVLKMPKSLVRVETHSPRSEHSEHDTAGEVELELTTDRATAPGRVRVAHDVAEGEAEEPKSGELSRWATAATPATPSGTDGFVVIE